ncbi:MAG: LemA family protein [Thermoplasmatota archaeon]
MIWLILLAIVVVLLVVLIPAYYYNKIIRAENRIDNAWAQIDVQLRRRAEIIPNLVETVKGYMEHEREVLEAVTQARASLMQAGTRQANIEADSQLQQALKSLFAVAEQYPDLKANQNFLQLQDELSHTENKVAYARQHYNDAVLYYNNAIETLPGRWFAGLMGRTERNMLDVPENLREPPRVSF